MRFLGPIFKQLENIVGKEHCSRKLEDLACYAYDATSKRFMPDVVVFPSETSQVAQILKIANKAKIPVIPRGSGSGMTGGSLPVQGGIVLVMTRFDKIINIDKDNLVAYVQPGVITGQFHKAVEKQGLFYPPDPSSSAFSTLGGNIAECAGGPRAVKYGVTRDYVLGLEVVLPNGEILNTGVQTAKGVVGYDLTRLIVGSEGTLGVITKIVLKLLPLPEKISTMTVLFDKMDVAAKTVSKIIRNNLIPRSIEYMDQASIKCAENYMKAGLPVDSEAMLIIEVDGKTSEVDESVKELESLCMQNGAASVKIAKTPDERTMIWKARKALSPALFMYGPDKINEDIVVPRSKIPDMVKKINQLREKTNLVMVSFGHAGDGNIHFNVMLDKKNKEQYQKAKQAVEEVFDYTLKLGGTISGEHGIGITKAAYLSKEIGSVSFDLMKNIKKVFDPENILNPDKIFSGSKYLI